MALYEKPGAASGPRDRKTHYNDPYDRVSREIRTVQKKVWGLDGLSKKERIALENSTNDEMAPKLAYSLNKSKRWELCLSPESFIQKMASLDQAYPIAAVDQSIVKGEYTAKTYSQKSSAENDVKSIKVKSGNGAPMLSLRDSVSGKQPARDKSRRRIKGETAKEYVETPSILYCIANHHSDELFFRRLIGKSDYGAWTSKKNKIVDLNDIEEASDVDSDFEDGEIEEEPEARKSSTLADYIVAKPSKLNNNKKRKNVSDFEIINELPKDKGTPKSPTLSNANELVESSITVTRYINIDTEYLQLPNFEDFEFMFDFSWLNAEKTKCLFVIPKSSADILTNFNSIIILELSESQKSSFLRMTVKSVHEVFIPSSSGNPQKAMSEVELAIRKLWQQESQKSCFLRMTVKSVHEVFIPSSSGNPQKAMSEVEVAIRKLWQQGITHLNKIKAEPKMLFYQPQTSIFSTFNPMGDFALLGLNKSLLSRMSSSSSSSENEYERIPPEGCDLCSHGCDRNLTTLKCGHRFCRYCSEKFIKEQIQSGKQKQQLSCAKCSTLLEPSFILISTPLLLLQAYLRFQFLRQENTLECPNKCGVAFIEENPKFGGVQCSKCKSVFCVKCKHEPHFPLTCDQMNLWETRFMPQSYLRFQFLKQQNTLECPNKCGVAFIEEFPKFGGVQCSKCKSVFCVKCKHEPHFPLTCDQMNLWETRFMPQYIAETRKPDSSKNIVETGEDEEYLLQSRWEVNRALHYHYSYSSSRKTPSNADEKPLNVTTSIASVCIEARYKRMKTKYVKSMIKQFDQSSIENIQELRNDLITVAFLKF
uniref:RING-type domain-containing protein n=1 Tax=Panagrolaimus sp. ES5 TaxID=591445 RepID=A0AC34FTB3_9BILA